ncbi:hypothetical protein PLESTB_000039400 [Pleodorina starrii]|uniref:phytol kinase n=1 Tax=Pleodorina starrii TaxID=330485 RepID=A0A9W6BAG4_9CHLO|nr:hypothetical protein PLESTB_000039400 [Pleodorina starrii]
MRRRGAGRGAIAQPAPAQQLQLPPVLESALRRVPAAAQKLFRDLQQRDRASGPPIDPPGNILRNVRELTSAFEELSRHLKTLNRTQPAASVAVTLSVLRNEPLRHALLLLAAAAFRSIPSPALRDDATRKAQDDALCCLYDSVLNTLNELATPAVAQQETSCVLTPQAEVLNASNACLVSALVNMDAPQCCSRRIASRASEARQLLLELADHGGAAIAGAAEGEAAASAPVEAEAAAEDAETEGEARVAAVEAETVTEGEAAATSGARKAAREVATAATAAAAAAKDAHIASLLVTLHGELKTVTLAVLTLAARTYALPPASSDGGGATGANIPTMTQLTQMAGVELAAALADSHVLEHTARAAVTSLELMTAATQAAGGPGGEALADSREQQRVANQSLFSVLSTVQMHHQFWHIHNGGMAPAVAGRALPEFLPDLRRALSGPCVQYLVLAAAVAVLCAADGGPSYGMQPGLLRLLGDLAVDAARTDRKRCLGVAVLDHITLPSLDALLAAAAGGTLSGPMASSRALLELTLRVGRLAVTSGRCWEQQSQQQRQRLGEEQAAGSGAALAAGQNARGDGTGGAGSSGGGGDSAGGGDAASAGPPAAMPLRLVVPRDDVLDMALRALHGATAVLRDHGWPATAAAAAAPAAIRAAAFDRWRLAVEVMAHVDWWHARLDVALPKFISCLRPQLPAAIGGGGCIATSSLEPPPPDLAAALAAGLLPCLERLLRRAGRDPRCPEDRLLTHLLMYEQEYPLVQLLTYSEPPQAAAFFATLGKIQRRAAAAHDAGGARRTSVSSLDGMVYVGCSLLVKGYSQLLFDMSCCVRPLGDAAASAALRRLGLVMSEVARVVLPLSAARLALAAQGLGPPSIQGQQESLLLPLPWIGIVASGGDGGGAGGVGVGGSLAASREDEAWRAAVLRQCEALVLLGLILRLSRDPRWGRPPLDRKHFILLAETLVLVAGVLPWEVREAARSHAAVSAAAAAAAVAAGSSDGGRGGGGAGGSGGSRQSARGRNRPKDPAAAAPPPPPDGPLSYWPPPLVRSLAADLREWDQGCTANCVEALAGQLEIWGANAGCEPPPPPQPQEGAGGDEDGEAGVRLLRALAARIRRECRRADLLAAGRALASPAEVAAVLRTCANPACVNLEGDSEAGLRLAACGRCGAAWYCCRDCQTAHWRAGHRAECGGGAAAAAAAGHAGGAGGE